MKVLIINLDKAIFSPGAESLERLKDYAGFCEKLSVIVLSRKKFAPIISGNLSVYATGSFSRIKYLFDALNLAGRIIKSDGADLVMTQDPFDTGFIGWLLKRQYKIPWQAQIHTDFLSPYFWRQSPANKFRVWLAKFLLPRADGVRVVSQRIKDSLKTKNYKLKTDPVVLPIFVDVNKIISAPVKNDIRKKYTQFDFIILMAARLSREKNIELAIGAMPEILKQYPKTGLIIAGAGAQKKRLEFIIQSRELKASVIFEPWTDDLISFYKKADLFLLTSNYEGWGMTVIEALAAGCPVIMTDVGCAGEVVINNINGLIIPVGDGAALVKAVDDLLGNEALRKELARRGPETLRPLPGKKEYLAEYRESWERIKK